VFEGRRRHIDVEFRSREQVHLYLRVERNLIDEEQNLYLVSLTDMTEVRENSEAMQAGYDEFVKLTTELEDALSTIEKQKALMECQRETLQNELNLARTVQNQLFTRDFSGFRLVRAAGFYEAMANLGGDMWEFHESPREFVAVIGDVMGHGVAASLISIAAKTLFRKHFEALDLSDHPGELGPMCTALNRELVEITHGNYYITVCLIRVDRSYTMDYVTAGHPPLFLVRRESERGRLLYTSQPMLGIFQDAEYESHRIQLRPGDRVLMYTDCLLESFDAGGNALNLQNAANLIRYAPDNSPEQVVQSLLDYRQTFSGSASLPDDLALVCVEVPLTGGETKPENDAPTSSRSDASKPRASTTNQASTNQTPIDRASR
jgi:sigma-B regulation protein RsbU (phosphoserine phosphatase)